MDIYSDWKPRIFGTLENKACWKPANLEMLGNDPFWSPGNLEILKISSLLSRALGLRQLFVQENDIPGFVICPKCNKKLCLIFWDVFQMAHRAKQLCYYARELCIEILCNFDCQTLSCAEELCIWLGNFEFRSLTQDLPLANVSLWALAWEPQNLPMELRKSHVRLRQHQRGAQSRTLGRTPGPGFNHPSVSRWVRTFWTGATWGKVKSAPNICHGIISLPLFWFTTPTVAVIIIAFDTVVIFIPTRRLRFREFPSWPGLWFCSSYWSRGVLLHDNPSTSQKCFCIFVLLVFPLKLWFLSMICPRNQYGPLNCLHVYLGCPGNTCI